MPTKEEQAIPLRSQIREYLLAQIQSMRPHDRISSIPELQAQFQTCRATVQWAVDSLEEERLIYHKYRAGIFVGDPNESLEEDIPLPVEPQKVEVRCKIGHLYMHPSSPDMSTPPACRLCGLPTAYTGRFTSPSLLVRPSESVPSTRSAAYYSLSLPDGCVYSI